MVGHESMPSKYGSLLVDGKCPTPGSRSGCLLITCRWYADLAMYTRDDLIGVLDILKECRQPVAEKDLTKAVAAWEILKRKGNGGEQSARKANNDVNATEASEVKAAIAADYEARIRQLQRLLKIRTSDLGHWRNKSKSLGMAVLILAITNLFLVGGLVAVAVIAAYW